MAGTDPKRFKYILSDELADKDVVAPEFEVEKQKSKENSDREEDASENLNSRDNAMQELLEKHVDCNDSPYEGPYIPLRKAQHLSTLKGKSIRKFNLLNHSFQTSLAYFTLWPTERKFS